jgi:hypothetical protein
MATTLEELEKRLTAVEQEVARLRQQVNPLTPEEAPAQRWARLVRESKASQPALSSTLGKAFEEMGIAGEPIGAEKVQELMRACGVNPEENAFSREIIEMREE